MRFIFALAVGLFLVIYVHATEKNDMGRADMTHFYSYPFTEEECNHGIMECSYGGRLHFVGKKSRDWVKSHHIIGVLYKDSDKYKLKTFRITQGNHTIEATVYDYCLDSDCGGCCTKDSKNTGFLIDMEDYTYQKFGGHVGVVQWECIDC